ncbi:DUF2630 family protein [Haematomicrobium sanguinis]|uniref:DUF2630 family protein n=1 Tax=Haematomicrobium sanguinis TaxID=479106 RepID=UPI00047D5454|nr:DUF2630 family protein [Haematomicrobium sanguinis]
MNNSDVLGNIDALMAEEHELRNQEEKTDETRKRLREVETQLDQCWDLLRQRRARAEFGQDPNDAKVRPASEVENYKN